MKKNIVFILITILILVSTFFISIKYIDSINNNVEDNYKIVFRGETIDNIYSTYVYKKVKYQTTKKKKKKKIITYEYINTIIIKNNADYTYSLEKIVNKGKTKNIDKISEIVEKNKATTYAEVKKDKSLIKIGEYKEYLI